MHACQVFVDSLFPCPHITALLEPQLSHHSQLPTPLLSFATSFLSLFKQSFLFATQPLPLHAVQSLARYSTQRVPPPRRRCCYASGAAAAAASCCPPCASKLLSRLLPVQTAVVATRKSQLHRPFWLRNRSADTCTAQEAAQVWVRGAREWKAAPPVVYCTARLRHSQRLPHPIMPTMHGNERKKAHLCTRHSADEHHHYPPPLAAGCRRCCFRRRLAAALPPLHRHPLLVAALRQLKLLPRQLLQQRLDARPALRCSRTVQ